MTKLILVYLLLVAFSDPHDSQRRYHMEIEQSSISTQQDFGIPDVLKQTLSAGNTSSFEPTSLRMHQILQILVINKILKQLQKNNHNLVFHIYATLLIEYINKDFSFFLLLIVEQIFHSYICPFFWSGIVSFVFVFLNRFFNKLNVLNCEALYINKFILTDYYSFDY